MSGEMTACTVCGFVGYPAELNWHKPHCRAPKPWIAFNGGTADRYLDGSSSNDSTTSARSHRVARPAR